DLLRLDPRRAGETARRLARLHCDRVDRADLRALDAIEPGDRPRGDVNAAAVGGGEVDPVLTTDEPAARKHDEILPGSEGPGRDLAAGGGLGGGFDHAVGR